MSSDPTAPASPSSAKQQEGDATRIPRVIGGPQLAQIMREEQRAADEESDAR